MKSHRQNKDLGDKSLRKFFNQLTRLWSVAALILYILILIQNLTGNFGENSSASWIWIFGNTVPVILLSLLISLIINPEITISHGNFRFLTSYIRRLSIIIISLLVIIILAEPFVNSLLQITILDLYHKSYFLLIPLQLFLIILMALVFVKSKQL